MATAPSTQNPEPRTHHAGPNTQLILACCVGLATLFPVGPASATTEELLETSKCIGIQQATWKFADSPLWNAYGNATDVKANITTAITSLQGTRRMEGSLVIDWVYDSSLTNSQVNLLVTPVGSSSPLGYTDCTPGNKASVLINYTAFADPSVLLRWTMRHEAMHSLRGMHTGERDSFDGHQSTLSTCIGVESSQAFRQDDSATLQFTQAATSPGYRIVSADPGLNDSAIYYGKSGGMIWDYSSGGVDNTARIRFQQSSSANYVYSSTRIMMGNSDRSYVARGAAKATGGTIDPSFRVELWSRWVEYPNNNSSNGCAYTNGILNPNGNPTNLGGWVLREASSTAYPGTSAYSTRSSSTIGGSNFNPNPAITDAHDLQWRAFGSAWTASGARAPIELDNLRIESRS